MFQTFSRILGLSSSTSTKRNQRAKPRRQFQPRVEALETREVPTATTTPEQDIRVGPESSTPQELVNVDQLNRRGQKIGEILYFTADDGLFGRELWMRTRNGRVTMVKDIFPGPTGSDPINLTEVGGRLFFSADNGVNGRELWVTNGTAAGTRMVEDINPGSAGSDPAELTAFAPEPSRFDPSRSDASQANRLYFAATDNQFGRELWQSDRLGTPQGTRIVEDVNPGLADSAPNYLTVAKIRLPRRSINVVYFAADRVGFGRELWRTTRNGQDAFLVKDIRSGPEGSNPFNLTKVTVRLNQADILFFGADDGNFGAELWRSNGAFRGTYLVEDINPGPAGSLEESATTLMAEFRNQLYFAADDGRLGRELWRSFSGRGSASIFKDINPGPNSSNPTAQAHPLPRLRNLIFRMPNGNDRLLFFGADNGTMGGEPWETNGTSNGTVILRDINVGPASSLIQNELVGIVFPDRLGQAGRILHFAADDGFLGRELWRSNGIIPNPLVNTRRDETDINPGSPSSDPSDFEISGGFVFFAAEKVLLGRELWQVRG